VHATNGRVLWTLLLMLAVGRVATAQDVITISGTVTTWADGLPVPGVLVPVVGADAAATATADATGIRCRCRVPPSARAGFR
jgi:hypothetical protein